MSQATRSPRTLRLAGRSFLAFVLAPEAPIQNWLEDLDAWMRRSTGFFAGRPVILDLANHSLTKPEVTSLLIDLQARKIRIIAVEGVNPAWLGPALAPLAGGGRSTGGIEIPDDATTPPPTPDTEKEMQPEAASLLLESPVRSGQSVVFPDGDVTIIGPVASGAEIVAGGSIHIYGALRGRAIAGSTGNARARIFCRKFEAELMVINGLYKAADEMGSHLRGRPVQAWLEKDAMILTTLD
ncbi:MAG: septum site-determining protein MinC [Methyloligellaceae bacterium]